MLVSITRRKGDRTHHAVRVDARLGTAEGGALVVTGTGHVTAWTDDPAAAGRFPEAVAKHVAAHYDGKPNAGDLTFRDESGRAVAATSGEAPPAPWPNAAAKAGPDLAAMNLAAERDEFQKQAAVLGAENERLHAAAEDAAARFKSLLAERDRLLARVAELESAATQQKKYADATAQVNDEQRKEIEALKKKVKELEDAAKKAADKK